MRGEFPVRAWRASVAALTGVLALVALLAALALGGISDPRPAGPLQVDASPDDAAGWALWPSSAESDTGGGEYLVTVPPQGGRALVTAPYTLRPPCTLEMTARHVAGPSEAGFGLWWGEVPAGPYWVVAVNGDGYFAVFRVEGDEIQFIEEWQLFPHLSREGATERLWVTVQEGRALVRLNDEVAASFGMPATAPLHTGLYVEASRRGGVTIAFERLRIWQAEPVE